MITKEFILTAILTILGPETPTPQVAIGDLNDDGRPGHRHGKTVCTILSESGPVCRVALDTARMKDHGRPSTAHYRYSAAENTVIHEICHVKVYNDAVSKGARLVNASWEITDQSAFRYSSHNRAWKKCMRKQSAWVDSQVRH